MMCVNIFSSFISFYVSFVILCPSSLAIEVVVYRMLFDSDGNYTGTSYKTNFHSGTIFSFDWVVSDIKDNLHVTAYRDDIQWREKSLSDSHWKYFDEALNLENITLFNIMLKICTTENICISYTIVEGRRVSDATPLSEADTYCSVIGRYSGCCVRVSLADVTTAYVLERNGSSVSTSTASTTTREPVTSVLAATDQPETVAADWTATIVTVAVTSAAVLLLALITVACIRLCRARTPGQPASDRFWNRFYVNNLMRDECDAEIRERERRDAEIRERERRDAEIRERERREAEPEYDYVYDHRYAPRTQRTR
ncbi:hypothetical protein B5X24_HaOG205914 [Helicoverpa armigera]|uniref:Uncharacterized protein n=1 Tax=Helicoverpa armigera TaxID=29058 RepID=A0A2W1BL32_HELAM|nr:hypothetical protein B5X24_HaOG205914 [Helicoverpa armigera]